MGDALVLKPNHFTYKRMRERREKERDRLCRKIGVQLEDAPLYDEELRMAAYEESLKR